jgi:hypothetical protein
MNLDAEVEINSAINEREMNSKNRDTGDQYIGIN